MASAPGVGEANNAHQISRHALASGSYGRQTAAKRNGAIASRNRAELGPLASTFGLHVCEANVGKTNIHFRQEIHHDISEYNKQ